MMPLTTRNTSSTERRVNNLRALIAELQGREMTSDEIASFLGYSQSATRNYIRDLRGAVVMEIARYDGGTATFVGRQVFCLTANTERVEAFIALLGAPAKKRIGGGRPSNLTKSERDPARHIHLLDDDLPFAVRMHRDLPIVHEPVLAAFFGLDKEVA